MTIIEFCGAPGCGKTKLCEALEDHMTSRGHSARNLTQEHKRSFFPALWYKLSYRHFKADGEIKAALKEYVAEAATPEERAAANKWADRILEFAYLVRTEKSKPKHAHYALCDAGCVQYLALSAGDGTLSPRAEDLVSVLKKRVYDGNKTVLVYCTADEGENVKRLLKHPSKRNGYADGDVSEIIPRLHNADENIRRAREMFGFRITTEVEIGITRNALEALLTMLRGNRPPKHRHSDENETPEETKAGSSVFMSLKDDENE